MNFDWSKVSEFQSTRQIHTMTGLVLFYFWSGEKQYCISLNSSRMCDVGPRMGGVFIQCGSVDINKECVLA